MGAIYPVGKWEGGEASGNQVNALMGGGGFSDKSCLPLSLLKDYRCRSAGSFPGHSISSTSHTSFE